MSHANNIISAPVDLIGDLQAIIPVTLQRTVSGTTQTIVSNDLGTMCRARLGDTIPALDGNGDWTVIGRVPINKWAKYKSLRNPIIANTGKTYGSTYWQGPNRQCGLIIDSFGSLGSPTTTDSFFKKLLDGDLAWDWDNPVSHYRLLDFDGYNHDAGAPMDDISYTHIGLNYANELHIQWEDIQGDGSDDSLLLSEIKLYNGNTYTPLTDFYFGALIYHATSGEYSFIADKTIAGGGLDVVFSGMSGWSGRTIVAVPFLSSVRLSQDTGIAGTFASFHLLPKTLEIASAGSVLVSFITAMWNATDTGVSYEIQIDNQTGNSITADLYISLLEGASESSATDVAHITLSNQTIPAHGTITPTGTLSYTRDTDTRYFLKINSLAPSTAVPQQVTEIEDYIA